MNFFSLMQDPTFEYVILPILIFLSRIVDVSMGTVRIIFVSKGMKYLAPVIGFFEVLIWLIVVSQIMQNLTNPINYLAYAAGFATGNFVGIYLEQRLAMGNMLLRIITQKKAKELIQYFQADGHYVTHMPAKSNTGNVDIIFLPVRRKEIDKVVDMVKVFNPDAIYTLAELRHISSSALPLSDKRGLFDNSYMRLFRHRKKIK